MLENSRRPRRGASAPRRRVPVCDWGQHPALHGPRRPAVSIRTADALFDATRGTREVRVHNARRVLEIQTLLSRGIAHENRQTAFAKRRDHRPSLFASQFLGQGFNTVDAKCEQTVAEVLRRLRRRGEHYGQAIARTRDRSSQILEVGRLVRIVAQVMRRFEDADDRLDRIADLRRGLDCLQSASRSGVDPGANEMRETTCLAE